MTRSSSIIKTNVSRRSRSAMTKDPLILCCLKLLLFLVCIACDENVRQFSHPNWKLHFPQGSQMGLFLAVAIPLYLPHNSAYLAFNWEANYPLPDNETEFTYPPIIKKRINRKLVYDALETKLQTQGYPGRGCMLRIICEASMNALSEGNGVLGDILHILLTPSTSKNQGLSGEYQKAEEYGKKSKQCKKYNEKCSVSFLDLISWLEHAM